MSPDPDSYSVLGLLMPMYAGSGKAPPIPLFFDRVNEGRPPTSKSLIFQLPFEILKEIALYLFESSLAALSLVNKDCCQLARSRRFVSVHLNYSIPQSHLIGKLLDEINGIVDRRSITSPSIGVCIRHLQIATDSEWAFGRLNIDYEDLKIVKEENEKRVQKAHSLFFGHYLPNIELILSWALPHLELLDIQDHVPLPRSFFNAMACSPVQHLRLFRVAVSEEFEIALPERLVHRGWPLRTLHLELNWRILGEGPWLHRRIFGEGRGSTAPLSASILRLCAPTLEKLTWKTLSIWMIWSVGREWGDDLHSLVGQEPPHFGRLRELTLENIKFSDYSTIRLLICPQPESRLQVLEIDADDDSLVAQFLESCGTIRSLKTFVWKTPRLAPDHPLAFLQQNSQLSKLSVYFPQKPALLDERILPILSQSFQELESLSLAWDSLSISNSALELIATLHSLQQIHLSAGNQGTNGWFIKHQKMRDYLRRLPNLKKLAFSRDAYETRGGFSEDYYHCSHGVLISEIPEDFEGVAHLDIGERTQLIWERQHRRLILKEADDYVRALPKLEWMHFGHYPMGVVNGSESRERHAVVLSEERDGCYSLLKRMFGRESIGF
ncbi:hypothetical protein MMC29_000349 [Sticta canariensis]|nr:hypothetical protein [Sticta canariensis]